MFFLSRGGWRTICVPCSTFVLAIAALVYYVFPKKVGEATLDEMALKGPSKPASPMSAWQVLFLPYVQSVSLVVFLGKVIRYAFIMWLPLYLSQALQFSDTEAAFISLFYDIGGIVGTLSIGFVTEQYFKNNTIQATMAYLLLASGALSVFLGLPGGLLWVTVIMTFFVGVGSNAPDASLTGTVPCLLNQKHMDDGGADITLQLVGLVNGLGSLGPIVEGMLIGKIADYYGWAAVMQVLIAFALLSIVLLYPVMRLA